MALEALGGASAIVSLVQASYKTGMALKTIKDADEDCLLLQYEVTNLSDLLSRLAVENHLNTADTDAGETNLSAGSEDKSYDRSKPAERMKYTMDKISDAVKRSEGKARRLRDGIRHLLKKDSIDGLLHMLQRDKLLINLALQGDLLYVTTWLAALADLSGP